ncbi:MAG: AAA family ATPase [Geobacter sp.]|nr:AAA family ATPase [Geobacter sp.]
MYEEYFKLNVKPFDLVPNPKFLFMSKSHKKALTYLDYGIRERVGFILLTGEVGSGKTTIIRDLIKKHHGEVVISKVFNTRVNSEQLIAMINDDFGIPVSGKDKTMMLRDLNDFLVEQYARGNSPVLIIDEAQNLTQKLLEEIRMLSNLETDSSKLLQIILVGQPELRSTMKSPVLRQLRQRISINCHLQPLSRQEVEQYILYRLEVAGNREAVTFSPGAFDLIYSSSRGIPRIVNILCDFLLISAFAEETNTLDDEMVHEVIGELDVDQQFWHVEVDEACAKNPVQVDTGEIARALQMINRRLDSIEKDSRSYSDSIVKEFGQKLTDLQNAFMFHVKETDAAVTSMGSKIDRLRSMLDDPGQDGGDKKTGLVKKLMGA